MPSHADRVRRQYVDAARVADATGSTLYDWLVLVRAEFEEISGLCLTQAEVEERWELPPEVAASILSTLVADGILDCTGEGKYGRSR